MADDRLGVVKLQDGDDDDLFAIVLVSEAVSRKNYMMNSSQRPLTESRVRATLVTAGISDTDIGSLLQSAREDFRSSCALPH